MKLIIDINDNEYMGIKEYPNNITSYPVTIHIYDAIRKGTPLPKQDKFDHQAKWLLNGLKIQINALADEKGNQLDLEDVIKIIDAYKEQEDSGFFDEIMDDESEDEETYEKIKEIITKVKEQEK